MNLVFRRSPTGKNRRQGEVIFRLVLARQTLDRARLENVGGARPVLYLQARQYLAGILPTKNRCRTLLSALSNLSIPRIPYTGFCGLGNRIDKGLQLSFL